MRNLSSNDHKYEILKQQANVVWGFPASNEWRLPKEAEREHREESKDELEPPEEISEEGRSRGESKEVEEEEKKSEDEG